MNNNYKSNCFDAFNEDAPKEESQTVQRGAHRREQAWQSTVFAGPEPIKPNMKKLGASDHGVDGLYGSHTQDNEAWKRKQTFASTVSKKEETRPPQFNE